MLPLPPLIWSISPVHVPNVAPDLTRFFMRARAPEGVFTLRPQDSVRADHLVKLNFHPALPEGLDEKKAWEEYRAFIDAKDTSEAVDRRRAELGLSDNEIGYVSELPNVLGLLEALRGAPPPASSIEEQIATAGFVFIHAMEDQHAGSVQVFDRPWKSRKHKGTFTLWVSAGFVKLTFRKSTSPGSWHNLARFTNIEVLHDGRIRPRYWPLTLPFETTALRAVLKVAESWDPEQVYTRV
jgi:hypothetical protein